MLVVQGIRADGYPSLIKEKIEKKTSFRVEKNLILLII